MPEDVFRNISDNYLRYFTYYNSNGLSITDDSIKCANSILRLFDMEYKNGIMYDLTERKEPYEPKSPRFKITPFRLSKMDEEDLVRILEKNHLSDIMSPLLECFGYIIKEESNRIILEFYGTYIYDIWKDFWKTDFNGNNSSTINWKESEDEFSDMDLSNISWNGEDNEDR